MTTHRLIRSTPAVVLISAIERHGEAPEESASDVADFPHWRYLPGAPVGKAHRWRTRLADGSVVHWCLEVEQGANGVLAHLSASAGSGPLTLVPRGLRRRALQVWTGHELAALARGIETASRTQASRLSPARAVADDR